MRGCVSSVEHRGTVDQALPRRRRPGSLCHSLPGGEDCGSQAAGVLSVRLPPPVGRLSDSGHQDGGEHAHLLPGGEVSGRVLWPGKVDAACRVTAEL